MAYDQDFLTEETILWRGELKNPLVLSLTVGKPLTLGPESNCFLFEGCTIVMFSVRRQLNLVMVDIGAIIQ